MHIPSNLAQCECRKEGHTIVETFLKSSFLHKQNSSTSLKNAYVGLSHNHIVLLTVATSYLSDFATFLDDGPLPIIIIGFIYSFF